MSNMSSLPNTKKEAREMSLRRLSREEVEMFAARTGIRKIAVENFLMTVHNNEKYYQARQNLELDTRLYNWNVKTVETIIDGIDLAYERGSEAN